MNMKKVGYLQSDKFLLHKSHDSHPESPHRIIAINRMLEDENLLHQLQIITAEPAPEDIIQLIHDHNYVMKLIHTTKNVGNKSIYIDPDTYINKYSYETIRYAIGGIANTIDYLFSGGRFAFCAVRPPGHHAFKNRGSGFCLVNNAAIAARFAQNKYDISKVLIIDWDVHHGNGTQSLFISDPSVFYLGIHQEDAYPWTKDVKTNGKGLGKGFTKNFGVYSGATDKTYRTYFQGPIKDLITSINPELIVISAGFDCHKDDQLGGTLLTSGMFGEMTGYIIEYSNNTPIISILEGGYNIDALQNSVKSHIKTFLDLSS